MPDDFSHTAYMQFPIRNRTMRIQLIVNYFFAAFFAAFSAL